MSEELGERLGITCVLKMVQQFVVRQSTSTSSAQEIPHGRDHFSDCKYLETTRFVHAVKVRRATSCGPMLETTGLTSDDPNEGAGRDDVWSIIQEWS